MQHKDEVISPIPLGSEGRDGALDFARRHNSEAIPEEFRAAIEDVLGELPDQFRTAIQAHTAFSNWLSSSDHSITEVARRLRDVLVAGQPYVEGYNAVEMKFPSHLDTMRDRLRNVKDEVLPGEAIEGEGTPGLTIMGGAGHA